MTIKAPVQPGYGTGQTLAPGAASATITMTGGSKQLILTNLGANPAYVRVGGADIKPATVADYPVPAGAQVVITKAADDNKLSHISPLGTDLHVMNGEGF
jgi:hypothetical protein